MKRLWARYRSLALYALFGAVTTAVNVAVYHVCFSVLHVANVPSTVAAWALSVVVAFVTNKIWVFGSRSFAPDVFWPELGKFVAARGLTGLLDVGVMFLGVDLLGGPGTLIKLGSNVLVILLNYVFSKVLIFKNRGGES